MPRQRRERRREHHRLGQATLDLLIRAQRNEITEHYVYKKLAQASRHPENRKVLEHIAGEELNHYQFWKKYTHREVGPSRTKIWFYYLLSRSLGLNFGVKLMERGEENAQDLYRKVSAEIPEAADIIKEEERHEKQILNLINEELLSYVSSIVLGLNDALVELTGALAGFTFALRDPKIISVAGFITGVAASFSMAASEYLSTRSEKNDRQPLRAAVYTGVAYLGVVLLLIAPYFLTTNVFLALALTLMEAVAIIFLFTFYISVAQGASFVRRFLEMAFLSLGVALVTFLIGFFVRQYFGLEL